MSAIAGSNDTTPLSVYLPFNAKSSATTSRPAKTARRRQRVTGNRYFTRAAMREIERLKQLKVDRARNKSVPVLSFGAA